ncbi:MAG: hypothetical protein ACI9SP_004644 [Arenicella sp.]|jgi:hypothetical protein
MTIVLPESFELYFQIAIFFSAGYHLAYLFKNLSHLFQKGIIMSVLTFAWMFGVLSVVLVNVEALQSWFYTLGYLAGFSLRFFRHDY